MKRNPLALVVVAVVVAGMLSVGFRMARRSGVSAAPRITQATVAPDFSLESLDGKNMRLSDLRGKAVLLNFWATWCGPCKIEMPWFVELQNQYGKDGLQALGVSVDDTVEKLKPYVSELKMNYPVLQGLGHDDMQEAYGPLWGIPVTVVISRDGKICTKHVG